MSRKYQIVNKLIFLIVLLPQRDLFSPTIKDNGREEMFIPENHNFEPFDSLLWLATPTPHPKFDGAGYEELDYIKEAFDDNWLSTEVENNRFT